MRRRFSDERGAFMVIFALMLLVLLGFTALGIEAGRWYLVRAELAKGVDAAALAGAKNISNPNVNPNTLADEFGRENFQSGYIGTPGSGAGEVRFNATLVGSDKVHVRGDVNATAILAQLFGVTTIPVSAESVAQKNDVEIVMILDRSGSMQGQKIIDLKTAAKNFLSYFTTTQSKDRVGLVSYGYTVSVDFPLGNNFVAPMESAIDKLIAFGATNMEDAFEQTGGPKGLPDQSTFPPGSPTRKQFIVFFSDGMPTALRDKFKYNGTDYDAVICAGPGNCRSWEYASMDVRSYLYKPNVIINNYTDQESLANRYGYSADTTGDGKSAGASACGKLTTKWYLFEKNPVPGYGPEACSPSIPNGPLVKYFCETARQLALDNAQILKNRGVKIYVVGLGTEQQLDKDFLKALSSGDGYTYITPNSSELEAIFSRIAKEIKLRLVQ
jgi:Flp pilus assembly protein TadG